MTVIRQRYILIVLDWFFTWLLPKFALLGNYITFTFINLADAFIQSDLQLKKKIFYWSDTQLYRI